MNEDSLLEETTYQIEVDEKEPVTPEDTDPYEAMDSARELNASLSRQNRKKRKKSSDRKSSKKRRKSKRRRVTHEELGPRPVAKIDLKKLENDVLQLTEQAASTGYFLNFETKTSISVSDSATREKLAQLPNEVQDESIMGELQRRFLVVILIFISDALTDASTLELLYELVSRATSMIQTYTRRVKEEQNFRQALLTTMKVAKKEQTEIVSEL